MRCASRAAVISGHDVCIHAGLGHETTMNILLVLIPLSLLLLIAAFAAFRWAVHNRQFEDLDAAALDVLREDRPLSEDCRRDAD